MERTAMSLRNRGFEGAGVMRRGRRLLRAAVLALVVAGGGQAQAETPSPLLEAASPYLRSHAGDPVRWRVWGPEAFAEAEATGKLVFLSIGYSACHWCHVMARDNFRDPATAALLNRRFVSVLVDREARPDIDALYQQAAAAMKLPTGWPLNLVLLPDGRPLYGGTYFPPERRQGMPAFRELLDSVWQAHRADPTAAAQGAATVARALAGDAAGSGTELSRAALDAAARRLLERIDVFHGGFGDAPKFPRLPALQALWQAYLRSGDGEIRDAVLLSLRAMSEGGMYDHLGGGFARYTEDPGWNQPHFEKMLDVNAQLLALLVEAWRETREPLFAARIRETVGFLLRDMRLPDGAFAAAIDSDSEGREGAFYVWTAAEIDAALKADAPLFKRAYGVTEEGNWDGGNVLSRHFAGLDELALETGLDATEIAGRLGRARARLAAVRDRRVRPLRDDKALTDWNALAIAALAEAGAALGEPQWIDAARAAFDAVAQAVGGETTLPHFRYDGKAEAAALLDDYVHMARAAVTLFEITGERRYLVRARGWAAATAAFYDAREGGFFLAAVAQDGLDMPRLKPGADAQTPSGNAAAAELLARLYFLTGEDGYRARAEDTVRLYFGAAVAEPLDHGAMLSAADTLMDAIQVVVVGGRQDAGAEPLLTAVWRTSLPGRVLQVIAPGEALPEGHPAFGKVQVEGLPTAYVCKGTFCSLPVTGPDELWVALHDIRLRDAP